MPSGIFKLRSEPGSLEMYFRAFAEISNSTGRSRRSAWVEAAFKEGYGENWWQSQGEWCRFPAETEGVQQMLGLTTAMIITTTSISMRVTPRWFP